MLGIKSFPPIIEDRATFATMQLAMVLDRPIFLSIALFVSGVFTINNIRTPNMTFQPFTAGGNPSVNLACTAFTSPLPVLSFCNAAFRRLPQLHTPGYFHTGGQYDAFRLPQQVLLGDCEVTVALRSPDTVSEQYSWLGVAVAATQLSLACQRPVGPTLPGEIDIIRTGGWTMTGDSCGVVIYISKIGPESTANNATVVGGELSANGTAVE